MTKSNIKSILPERPCLQLAVDTETLEEGLAILEKVYPSFDIVEVGTPLIIAEGVRAVNAIKNRYPDKLCLADVKIMDAGRMEADIAFKAGADIVTVLGCADDATITGVVASAKANRGLVMADLINIIDLHSRANQLQALGVDILCAHASVDSLNNADSLFRELAAIRHTVECPLAIAGGVNSSSLADAVASGAKIAVVGSAIIRADKPAEAAAAMMDILNEIKSTCAAEKNEPSHEAVIGTICKEIDVCTSRIDAESIERMLGSIARAKSIFCGAAGRSGMAVRGFAMRLMHAGLDVNVLGDVTTPAITKDDLLIIGSGSGSTGSLVNAAAKAKAIGAEIALITIDPDSPIAKTADIVIQIPAPSPKAANTEGSVETIQPMGSLFEQSMSILLDSIVVMYMQRHAIDSDTMFKRHANLE